MWTSGFRVTPGHSGFVYAWSCGRALESAPHQTPIGTQRQRRAVPGCGWTRSSTRHTVVSIVHTYALSNGCWPTCSRPVQKLIGYPHGLPLKRIGLTTRLGVVSSAMRVRTGGRTLMGFTELLVLGFGGVRHRPIKETICFQWLSSLAGGLPGPKATASVRARGH